MQQTPIQVGEYSFTILDIILTKEQWRKNL